MGEIIQFPFDVSGILREDILACLRRSNPDGCVEDTYLAGANEMTRWLLRPGGAVQRLLDTKQATSGGAA